MSQRCMGHQSNQFPLPLYPRHFRVFGVRANKFAAIRTGAKLFQFSYQSFVHAFFVLWQKLVLCHARMSGAMS